MIRRTMIVLSMFAALVTVGVAARGQEDEGAGDASGWPSRWVNSLAPLGEGRVAAATATGLPLRPSSVVAFAADAPDAAEVLYEHPASVWEVVASPDGARLASSDYRGNLVIADAASGEASHHEGAFERWTRALAFSPDGSKLVAGNEAGKLFVWDVAEGKVVNSLEVGDGQVFDLAMIGEDRLAVADGAGKLHLLRWPELKTERTVELGGEPVWTIVPVGGVVIAAGADQTVRRVRLEDAEAEPEEVGRLDDWVTAGAVAPGGTVALATARGGLSLLADPAAGQLEAIGEAPSGVWALAFAGERLLAGTRKHQVTVFHRAWTVEYAAPDPDSQDADE